MSTVPNIIYKYHKIDNYSLENLKNSQIYFNTPNNFNDPFEIVCNLSYDNTKYQEIFNHYKQKFPHYQTSSDFNENSIKNSINDALNKMQEEILNKRGCWCASKNNNNILMWSHYADYHKGMCLEFDTSLMPKELSKLFRNVTYSDNPINLCSTCIIGICKCSDINSLLYTKFTDWKYEEEVRALHIEPNKIYGYEIKALKAVYFGIKVDNSALENIRLTIPKKNKDIKFFRGFLNPNSYEIDFKQI